MKTPLFLRLLCFLLLLAWSGHAADTVTVDNADASGVTVTGAWTAGTNPGFWGTNYIHDGNTAKGTKSVRLTPNLPVGGVYEVFLWWSASTNRATNVPVDITHSGGVSTVTVNQQLNGSQWNSLGSFTFAAGTAGNILIRTNGTNGYVFADAVRFVPAGLSPFAISMSASSRANFTQWAPAIAATGVKWVRGTQGINNVTPSMGTYNWVQQDALLNNGASYGMQFIGSIAYNAAWINSNTQTFPTDNLPAWGNYVYALVNHCKDRVKYWEVGNEPPNFTSGGTPAQYAQTMTTAYARAKEADPGCLVGLAAKSSDINWLYKTLNAGATDKYDFVSLHPYEVMGGVQHGFEGSFMAIVPTLRKLLQDRNPAKANVPVLFTEIGEPIGAVNGVYTTTDTSQAENLIKVYTMSIAQGVSQINWFEGRDGDSGLFGLMTSLNVARPAYNALDRMIEHFGQNPEYKGWVLLNTAANPDRDYGFVFQGATTTVMVMWAPPGVSDTIIFSQSVQVVDPVSGAVMNATAYPLTNAPVFVVGVPPSLVTQAQANKNQPFPWGGDFTGASSVSITMPDTDAGLHHYKKDTTSTAVTAPYGAARNCDKVVGGVQKGVEQFFTVDPNFLSYTPTPIDITIVVRRNAANDPASVSLAYESPTGMKSAPSFTIPGNTQWYTHTWSVSDPQFVGNFLYNFRLSSATAKYYLQSVTVTKTGGGGGGSQEAFITGQTLGNLRNNFTGWAGFKFTTGASPVTVTDLGRWVVSGNSAPHAMRIVDASGATVATATVNTSGASAGGYAYAALASPVTLAANTVYYIGSQETSGGDQFHDYSATVVTTTNAATVDRPAYSSDGASWSTGGSVGNKSYVPVNFKYQ